MRNLWTQAGSPLAAANAFVAIGPCVSRAFLFCAAQQMTETPDANMPGIWEHIIAFSSSFRPYRRVRFRLPRARKISLTEPARHELTNMLPAGKGGNRRRPSLRSDRARTESRVGGKARALIADDRLAGRIVRSGVAVFRRHVESLRRSRTPTQNRSPGSS